MFIRDFKVLLIEHAKLKEDILKKIIRVKQYYWDYSYAEHKQWLYENVKDDEYHLVIMGEDEQLIAYLNMIKTHIFYHGGKEEVMGIGNVCVAKNHLGHGLGQLIMEICNYHLRNYQKRAILLCKENLVDFYKNSGWVEYDGYVTLEDVQYLGVLMTTKPIAHSKISLPRNF